MIRKFFLGFAAVAMAFAPTLAAAQNTTPPAASDLMLISRQDANSNGTRGAIAISKAFNVAGIGYSTGAGGAVTQITSRTTGVTLNTLAGQVTMFSAAGSATAASFTVTNSQVTAKDTIVVSEASGTNLYELFVTAVAAGSFQVTFLTTGGTATDAPVLNFTVIHGASS